MEGSEDKLNEFLKAKGFNKYTEDQEFATFSVAPSGNHPLARMKSQETIECCLSGVNPFLESSLTNEASGVGVGFVIRSDSKDPEAPLKKAYPTLWVKTSYGKLYWRQEPKESIHDLRYQEQGAEFPTGEILRSVYKSFQ